MFDLSMRDKMSYSRFGSKSNWYLWWDTHSGKSKDTQILAIAHARDMFWPRYFTYKQLKNDLESCLFIYRLYLPYKSGIKFTRLRRCIKSFLEDVEKDFKTNK